MSNHNSEEEEMNATTKKALTGSRTTTLETEKAVTEISRIGIVSIGVTSALIGLWSLSCMIGGMVESGGPLSLIKSWYGAVIGV